jgi:hypothetical protein
LGILMALLCLATGTIAQLRLQRKLLMVIAELEVEQDYLRRAKRYLEE